jgi:uncharacterized protein involved in type VI secretion and phage assembly
VAEEDTRRYGVYRAIVVDARDPTGNGRVRLQLPGVTGDTEAWAPVAISPPEEGDTVVVAFEEGDVGSPIVIGVLWRSDD